MKRFAALAASLALALPLQTASGQVLNARRMAMGGVVLPTGGSEGFNAAYRAVPPPPQRGASEIPLPIGLVPLLSDPPELDPDDPEFNLYELANHLYRLPWNLALVEPETPSNDITIELGRNHLAVELGEIRDIFPDRHSEFGANVRVPTLGFGVGRFHVGLGAVVHYENDLELNDPLYAALANGEEFQTNTDYAIQDDALGQAAAALELGWAAPLVRQGDPRTRGGMAVIGGVRARLLRGLAYADARNAVTFGTLDTLFSDEPIRLDYLGFLRQADPQHGGFGHALDLGVVWVQEPFEIGLGVNDVVSRIGWKVEESVAWRDSIEDDIVDEVVAEDVAFDSELPRAATINAAWRTNRLVIAADAVTSMGHVTGHVGAERWVGRLALRGGVELDAEQSLQVAGGVGLRLGGVGLDIAVATHQRNLTRERGVELGLGLAFYR